MEDNTTSSVFGLDLGGFFGDIGNKVAQSKGYDDLYGLATGEAAKNVARLTTKPGADVKQTPAVIQPGAWSQQIAAVTPFKLNLSNSQLLLLGLALAGGIYLIARR